MSLTAVASTDLSNDPIDVEIYDVQTFSREHCDCSKNGPMYLGKICIAATKWDLPKDDSVPYQDTPPLTHFEASVEKEIFKFASKAYYMQCQFGETPIVFTDPNLQNQFKGQNYFDFIGVQGSKAWVRLKLVDANGVSRIIGENSGPFVDEKFWSNKGESAEYYRQQYAGLANVEMPLEKVLTDFQIRRILDGDGDIYKTMQATLMIEKTKKIGFGEYTIKLRFFLEPGKKPKHSWDTSVIGMQYIKN